MKQLKLLIIFSMCLFFTSCSFVEPNHEGILMENYGKSKDDFSVQAGKVWTMAPGSELFQVPMYEQKGDCPPLKVFAKDGGEFTVDPSYTYSPIRGKGIDILFAYKHLYGDSKSFYDNVEGNILNTRVLNACREEARNFTTDSLMNNVARFETSVQTRLAREFTDKFFALSEITSSLTPPESMARVIEERNNQIQQANKLKNEMLTRETQIKMNIMNAEAEVKVAKLNAEATEIKNRTLTGSNLQKAWIDKWDGVLPTYVAGSGTNNLIQIPSK
jgi:regulator of protease activity HflC (stomatin/prohibitin superfamily)